MGTQANVLTPQQMRCIYALARGGGISNEDLHAVVFATTGKDSMKLMVLGNDDRIELVSLFDNLGKNRGFLTVFGAIAVVQILMTYLGGAILQGYGLYPVEWLMVLVMAISIIPIDLIRKAVMRSADK